METAKPAASQARGIRNNNPGNIEHNIHFYWLGEDQPDADGYCRFKTAREGLRAMVVLLHNYRTMHHAETIRNIIARWAPPEKNDTASYIEDVSARMQTPPDAYLPFYNTIASLLRAIIYHENGCQPYDNQTIQEAITSARVR